MFTYIHSEKPKKQQIISLKELLRANSRDVEVLNISSSKAKFTNFKPEKVLHIPLIVKKSLIPGSGDGVFVTRDVPKHHYIYQSYYHGHLLSTSGKSINEKLDPDFLQKFPPKYFLQCSFKENYILPTEKDVQTLKLVGPKINSSANSSVLANGVVVKLQKRGIYFALFYTIVDVSSGSELYWFYKFQNE